MDIARIGREVLVNSAVLADQHDQVVAPLADGRFVVAWVDESQGLGGAQGDSHGPAIKAQIFSGDGVHAGSEILANHITAALTLDPIQIDPQVSGLPTGGFVVTWTDFGHPVVPRPGIDISSSSVWAQMFSPDGRRFEAGVRVNTATMGSQDNQKITTLADGGFVVTWTDFSEGIGGAAGDDSAQAVKAQFFTDRGLRREGEILINTVHDGPQYMPEITTLADGKVVFTYASTDGDFAGIRAQIYQGNARRAGSEFIVNKTIAGVQEHHKIVALEGGGFVVTWEDEGTGDGASGGDGGDVGIRAQVFAANGARVGDEILVNTATNHDQIGAQIASLAGGGFVITWADFSVGIGGASGDSSGSAIKAQVFAADGSRVGAELLVNTATAGDQSDPQVVGLSDENFAIAWTDGSYGVGGATGDRSGTAIKVQAFAADGTTIGSELLVNDTRVGNQADPRLAALFDGRFVVTWTDANEATGLNIKSQVFDVDPGTDHGYASIGTTIHVSFAELLANDGWGMSGPTIAAVHDAFGGSASILDNEIIFAVTSDAAASRAGFDYDVATDSGPATRHVELDLVTTTPLGDMIDIDTRPGDFSFVDGGGGHDTLHAGAGRDTLVGGAGYDTMIGESGDDTYVVDASHDRVVEAIHGGFDTIAATCSYTLENSQEIEVLRAAPGASRLSLTGNYFHNVIFGSDGADTIASGGGGDELLGGNGDDKYTVFAGDVIVEKADEGIDSVFAIAATGYVLTSGVEVEHLYASASYTGIELVGNELNNILHSGARQDTLIGQQGDDVYYVNSSDDLAIEAIGEGYDEIYASGRYVISPGSEIEYLRAARGVSGIVLTGNELANTIIGSDGADVLDGAGGADLLMGGLGDDRYYVDTSDALREAIGGGIDTVYATADFALTARQEIEYLRAVGPLGVVLRGNDLANTVVGAAGADTLDGGSGGVDLLVGGEGDDTYIVSHAGMSVREGAGAGHDAVFASVDFRLSANVEMLTLASSALKAWGNDIGNTILGNADDNVLSGRGGDDRLIGGLGADVLVGGVGADAFVFTALADSAPGPLRDLIRDFSQSELDVIDLSAIQAVAGAATDQAFDFCGTAAFTGAAGELHQVAGGGATVLEGDVNGDAIADFQIAVSGLVAFAAGDVIL